MKKLTRSNIAYDLTISPHSHLVEYEGERNLTFIFSSDLYRRKFIEKLDINRNTINESLSNRFGFNIKLDELADLKLYKTIEKRGFLIFADEGVRIWQKDNLTLDGVKRIIKP